MAVPAFPTTDAVVMLPGPAGVLEVAVDSPEADVTALPLVAIICHPLPIEGGTMHNKVVTMAARALRELGATTVRFNFRGTGASEGVFDHGEGERDDLRAVAAWVRAARPGDALFLAGFSFGAYVSISAAEELQPRMLVSIAPPAGRWQFADIATPTMPWLVVQGEEDEIVDPAAVYAWLDALDADVELVRMPETSHFFHRKLMDLRGVIKQSAQRHLPEPHAG
jgi:alpha/beta superfamily hydrolase